MKKGLITFAMLLPFMMITTSCKSNINVHELQPYLFQTDTYKELDYQFAHNYYKKNYDNWGGGGCSAISKIVDGHRLVGRNMDLNISKKCAYIIPAETGKYKTIGLMYTFRDISPDYEKVRKEGIDSDFGKILPFMCDDVLNEAGLHIELNMRHAEFWPNGDDMFACEHTNEFSETRVHMFELPRLIGDKCATVSEAIQYMSSLDVYSQNKYWNYCFVISDAYGGTVLVEFCLNQMLVLYEDMIPQYNAFLDKYDPTIPYRMHAIGQTNFYVNYTAYLMQNTKTGTGRYRVLQENIDSVKNKDDLFKLMNRISYSWFYQDYDICKNEHFDPRSEQVGEFKGATYNFIMNPEYEEFIKAAMNAYSEPIRSLTRNQKREKNEYWESTFTEVVDCTDKTILIRFYEDFDYVYNISFDGVKKITYSV